MDTSYRFNSPGDRELENGKVVHFDSSNWEALDG